MSVINSIHTPCKSCVYAKYEGNSQTDCYLSFIDKYKQSDVEVLEAYDLDKEFYIINNKKCIGYRENSWFVKHNMENSSIEEKVNHFKSNNYIKYLLIINLRAFDNVGNLDDLKKALSSLSIHPQKIVFVRYINNTLYEYQKLLDILNDVKFNGKWRIQTVLHDDYSFVDTLHDAVNHDKRYRFILSADSSNLDDLNTIVTKSNSVVYDELKSFLVFRNKDKSINMFSAPNYRQAFMLLHKNLLEMDEVHSIL